MLHKPAGSAIVVEMVAFVKRILLAAQKFAPVGQKMLPVGRSHITRILFRRPEPARPNALRATLHKHRRILRRHHEIAHPAKARHALQQGFRPMPALPLASRIPHQIVVTTAQTPVTELNHQEQHQENQRRQQQNRHAQQQIAIQTAAGGRRQQGFENPQCGQVRHFDRLHIPARPRFGKTVSDSSGAGA
ncbi:hypothetical protein SDC9_98512 [bioreactor metagenome]|uniref:Uncharacterized protein n=1 Tax=bioreactor metagenome TaxID=1076179 RepID=A0A645AHK1_9ZZZZ